jgi:hypothetical protein
MKKPSLLALLSFLTVLSFSQQTHNFIDPQRKFDEAKEYFQKEQYNLSYPLLKELQGSIRETDKVNNPVLVQEINYYTIVSSLKQNEGRAENEGQRLHSCCKKQCPGANDELSFGRILFPQATIF